MRRMKAGDIALIVANAVVWGTPTAIYAMLDFYQFEQGNWSLILLAIGPLPYGAGLALSTLGFVIIWRRGLISTARAVGITSLIVGIPFAACGVVMLGST